MRLPEKDPIEPIEYGGSGFSFSFYYVAAISILNGGLNDKTKKTKY